MSDPIWNGREKKQFPQAPQSTAPNVTKSQQELALEAWNDPKAEGRFMVVFTPGRQMKTIKDGSFDLRKMRGLLTAVLKILDPLIAAQDELEAAAQQLELEQQIRDAHALATLPLDGRN